MKLKKEERGSVLRTISCPAYMQDELARETKVFEDLSLDDLYADTAPPPKMGGIRDKKSKSSASEDAPGRLESAYHDSPLQWSSAYDSDESQQGVHRRSENIDIVRKGNRSSDRSRNRRRLYKQKSWSTEASCEEAWERRRDQFLLEQLEASPKSRAAAAAIGRCTSDLGRTGQGTRSRTRTRSLTDDDLEELRGCIDLGFGFSSKEDPKLCTTVPALELCYAIARQFQEVNSPISSVCDGDVACDGSPLGSPGGSWRISSPGDHPQQVKTRLRHWAQAVACTVRQCC